MNATGNYLPSVAVVVAAYNAEATIGDCVSSLLELRYPQDLLEIVVVNNGSRDRTAALLTSFGSAITVLDEPLRGPAAARNAGVRHSRSDVVAFTDADCTVDPGWLGALVAPLHDPQVGVAGGLILARRPASGIELFGELVHDHRRALASRPPYAITMNWASSRSVLSELGLFDAVLRRCSDGDLAYRIGQRGYSFAFSPNAIVYHRNERSLAGLFREGFQHSFYAVPVVRRHAHHIAEWRARHPAGREPAATRSEAPRPGHERAFVFGKRLGRAAGRLWFSIAPLDGRARSQRLPTGSLEKRSSSSPPSTPSAFVLLLRRLVVRTARGPLRPLWSLLHHGLMRGVAAALRWRHRDRSVYVKGSFAFGDPVYGISDIDMIVVAEDHPTSPGENRQLARNRWERLSKTFPLLRSLMQHFWIYEEAELRSATSATCLTYGIGRSDGIARGGEAPRSPVAAYLGSHPLADDMALLAHPPFATIAREWRLLAGGDRRGPETAPDAQERRIRAWLELQFLWRSAYRVCLEPDQAHVPFLCVKFVADPVRIWLWMTRGEYVAERGRALERGLVELPEEEDALRRALALHGRLSRSPEAPLDEFLPFFLRLTSRIAGRIAADLSQAGATDVRLLPGEEADLALPLGATDRLRRLFADDSSPELLPLVDWRAVAIPPLPDETFSLVPANPCDPTSVAAAAKRMDAGRYAAIRSDGLLLMPARVRALLRSVQCAATDPVSFALAEGRATARFPDVPGWSAADWARRAVAEHRAWLESHRAQASESGEAEENVEELARLLTAIRAALFLESLDEGDPELALPLAAVAEQLRAREGDAGSAALEAVEAYRTSRRESGSLDYNVMALSEIVRKLPAYDS